MIFIGLSPDGVKNWLPLMGFADICQTSRRSIRGLRRLCPEYVIATLALRRQLSGVIASRRFAVRCGPGISEATMLRASGNRLRRYSLMVTHFTWL